MKSIAALVVLAGVASSASAAVVYNNRATWSLASGAGAAQETFEGYQPGVYASPFGFISGLFAGAANNAGVQMAVEAGNPSGFGFANTTVAGANYLRFQDGIGQYSIGLAIFGSDVSAMGLDISGFQPNNNGVGGITINLYDAGLTLISSDFYASGTDFNAQFLGVISATPFRGMELVMAPLGGPLDSSDYAAIDDVTWVAVPAPSAAGLLGLGGLLAARRRRA